jgi:hypothetical protein
LSVTLSNATGEYANGIVGQIIRLHVAVDENWYVQYSPIVYVFQAFFLLFCVVNIALAIWYVIAP